MDHNETEHVEYLQRAVELSRVKMRAGESGPFAAVVVKDGRTVDEGWNRVTQGRRGPVGVRRVGLNA